MKFEIFQQPKGLGTLVALVDVLPDVDLNERRRRGVVMNENFRVISHAHLCQVLY
jgi:hypothetical protein